MTPDEYCQQRAASSGSSFYYSFLFLPRERRQAITALYAFCREVDDVVDECNDPAVARAKLQWWREEVANTFAGQPQHPVGQALKPVVEQFQLPEEHFQEIIDGMEMDLNASTYPSFKELSLYCYRVASVVGLLSAEIFGYQDRHTLKYAHDLGLALQLTNILRDIREDATRGRLYLPTEELVQFGVTAADICNGRNSDGMQALLRHQAERAEGYYQSAFARLPEGDRYRQRSGVIMAEIYRNLLRRIETEGYPVLERRVSLSPWRKLWLAWTTARRENRRHHRHLKAQRA